MDLSIVQSWIEGRSKTRTANDLKDKDLEHRTLVHGGLLNAAGSLENGGRLGFPGVSVRHLPPFPSHCLWVAQPIKPETICGKQPHDWSHGNE